MDPALDYRATDVDATKWAKLSSRQTKKVSNWTNKTENEDEKIKKSPFSSLLSNVRYKFCIMTKFWSLLE